MKLASPFQVEQCLFSKQGSTCVPEQTYLTLTKLKGKIFQKGCSLGANHLRQILNRTDTRTWVPAHALAIGELVEVVAPDSILTSVGTRWWTTWMHGSGTNRACAPLVGPFGRRRSWTRRRTWCGTVHSRPCRNWALWHLWDIFFIGHKNFTLIPSLQLLGLWRVVQSFWLRNPIWIFSTQRKNILSVFGEMGPGDRGRRRCLTGDVAILEFSSAKAALTSSSLQWKGFHSMASKEHTTANATWDSKGLKLSTMLHIHFQVKNGIGRDESTRSSEEDGMSWEETFCTSTNLSTEPRLAQHPPGNEVQQCWPQPRD